MARGLLPACAAAFAFGLLLAVFYRESVLNLVQGLPSEVAPASRSRSESQVSSPGIPSPSQPLAKSQAKQGAAPKQQQQQQQQQQHAKKPAKESKPTRLPRVCLHNDTSNAYYQCRRKALLRGCSEICDTNITGKPSLYFDFVSKHVDCNGLWMNEEIDAAASDGQWPPPAYPPAVFLRDFTQQGKIRLDRVARFAQRYSGGDAHVSEWVKADIEQQVESARRGSLHGTYGAPSTNEVRLGLKHMDIKNKRVLVIGSERPWAEACALEAGAAEVWTLEYGKIYSTHPKIKTLTPDEAREMYIKGTLPMFDAVITYSSVEHSGLGRYGDALNPWGDMQAIARAWCVTKLGGQMLLGVAECGPADRIEFNLHRCYYKTSYTHLTANWKQEYRGRTHTNGLLVLRKVDAPSAPRAKPNN